MTLLAFVALAAWAPGARAAAQWLPAENRTAAEPNQAPDVAMNQNGDVAAVWVTAAGIVQLSVRPAGGLFEAPVNVSAAGAGNAHVAIDAAGGVVVVWEIPAATPPSTVQAAVRPAGQGFQPIQTLSTPGDEAREPQLAMDGAGNVVVVWLKTAGIVQASVRAAGGSFVGPFTISTLTPLPVEQAQQGPQVAIDPAGNATVVWTNTNLRVRAVMRRAGASFAGATFSTAANVFNGPLGVLGARVAMNPAGEAVAVWQTVQGGGNSTVNSASSFGGAAFGTMALVSPTGQNLTSPQVALSQSGEAIAVWQRLVSAGNNSVQSAIRSPAGAWAPRGDLPNVSAIPQAPRPQIEMNAAGDAIAAWLGTTGSNAIVQSVTRPAGGTFSLTPTNVSEAGVDARPPLIAIDGEGDGAAVWVRGGLAQTAGYDAVGPQMRGLTGPATAEVGSSTAWSVSPLDVWSGVGSTTWSFGDGGIATGASAQHTFGAPGTYTVTVTSTDGVGNPRSAARTIAVVPRAVPPETDNDRDGFPQGVADCDDANPAINRGAVDKPGNRIDEDCDGKDAPYPLLGSAIFSSFSFFPKFTTFTALSVRPGKAGSTIRVDCIGGGCRFKVKKVEVPRETPKVTLDSLVKTAKLRPRAKLEIRVTKPDTIGVMRTLTVRAGRRPTTVDTCLAPGKTTPPKLGESCDGVTPRIPLLGSRLVNSFDVKAGRTTVKALSVRPGKVGSTVRLRCSGRGCAFNVKTRAVTRATPIFSLTSLMKSSKLRAGAKLEIRVTKPNTIGIVRTLTVRARKAPTRVDRCLVPGATAPVSCSS